MNSDSLTASRIVDEALTQSDSERRKFVQASCENNRSLQNTVFNLLEAYTGESEDSLSSVSKEELWDLVYDELRKLAQAKLSNLPPGQTLQATALVHEVYLRLSESENALTNGRAYFFAAAAESMRRILIDEFRRKNRQKRGGGWERVNLDDLSIAEEGDSENALFIHEALDKLEAKDPLCAELVKLRFFVGMSNRQAALVLDISERTAARNWTYSRAWLASELREVQQQ